MIENKKVMKILIATEKPFAEKAAKGIQNILEKVQKNILPKAVKQIRIRYSENRKRKFRFTYVERIKCI